MTAKPRSAVTAAVLSFLAFGAGHLYVGRIRRALMALSFAVLVVLLIGLLGAASTMRGFALMAALTVGVWVLGIVDSALLARSVTEQASPWYSRWYWYVAWILVAMVARWAFIQAREPVLGFNTFRVATPRMEPLLRKGEFVLIDARVYDAKMPRFGEIVAVRGPDGTKYVRYVSEVDASGVEVSAMDEDVPRFRAAHDDVIGPATVIWYSSDHARIGLSINGAQPTVQGPTVPPSAGPRP